MTARAAAGIGLPLFLAGCLAAGSGMSFYRVEGCRACLCARFWTGTDSPRRAGTALQDPALDSAKFVPGEFAEAGLLGVGHRHDWALIHESVDGPGDAGGRYCSLRSLWRNGLVGGLERSERARKCMAEQIALGTVRVEDLEIALHHSEKPEESTPEDERQVYDRVLAVARSFPGWKER